MMLDLTKRYRRKRDGHPLIVRSFTRRTPLPTYMSHQHHAELIRVRPEGSNKWNTMHPNYFLESYAEVDE
jgi:hypothetical protein